MAEWKAERAHEFQIAPHTQLSIGGGSYKCVRSIVSTKKPKQDGQKDLIAWKYL